jgi:integrase
MSAPRRIRLEPGIFERVNDAGERLGLDIAYKDADGRPRRRTVHGDIHAARDELAAARTRRARVELEPANPRTILTAVIDRNRQTVLAGARKHTRQVHGSGLNRAQQRFGNRRISTITRADIRAWIAAMTDEGLMANTVRGYYSTLRVVYTFAARDLDMPIAFPALRQRDLPDPRDDQRDKRVLTNDELQKILAELGSRDRLYFRLLAETGPRASEGLGVSPEQIDGTTLKVRRQRAEHGKLAPLKTGPSRRDIEITRGLAVELKLAGAFPVGYDAVLAAWNAAVEASGIDRPHPVIHDLRHTHASKLIAAGWDLVEVAKRLGDSVKTVSQTYAHEFDARRRSVERQAALESLYAEMATEMATSTPSQAITHEAKVQHLRAFR